MVRADRNKPPLYFGQPGRSLMTLPYPKGGYTKPYDRQTFDFVTGSGMHQVSSLSTGSRAYEINWEALHLDSYAKLEQYRIGANGAGPWVLIDPSAPNLLPPNVAASTALYNDASEFFSAGGAQGVVSSGNSLSFVHRANGWRNIRWRWTTTPATNCTFTVMPLYRNWPGMPVLTGLPYTFSSWVIPDGVIVTNPQMSLTLTWLNAAGATISTSTSGTIATGNAWYRLSVTATAPALACYVTAAWNVVGATVANNGVIYIDEPLLEQDSVVNDWAASGGIRSVEILGLSDTVSNFASRFRTSVQLQLRELSQ